MKGTLIFDLDGTLLNTLDDLADAVNFALVKMQYPTRTLDEVRRFVGNGIKRLIERAVPNGTSPANTDSTLEIFKEYYGAHSLDKTQPYDGICEMLKAARDGGYKLAVVSNKADFAAQKIVAHYFGNIFDFVLGQREDIRKKPAPDMVLSAMNTLGALADETVYIGDSDVDIITAKNTGVDSIGVLWGFRDRQNLENAGCAVFADTPMDILAFIK